MKRLLALSLLATALVPAAAQARTTAGELWRDRQDIREERHELEQARRYGTPRDIREERREYRDARQEYREDLQDWRQDRARYGHHRGYRKGHWNAPFAYRPYRPGWNAHPHHYGSRYFISHHGLPRAYYGHRWVRHYDDALLIDLRTGSVRRVIRGFYW